MSIVNHYVLCHYIQSSSSSSSPRYTLSEMYSSQCLAQLKPARVGNARSVHVQLWASPHVIRWDIVWLSPQSHTSVWESFHIFIMTRQCHFCTLNRFKLLQLDQGSSVPLAKCSFGMIPLSRHSVDRSPRAFHSSTHNVVRASCFEVLSASVESRKLFLDVSLCLAGRWPWSGCLGSSSLRQRSALAAIFRRMWGGAIHAISYKKGIGVTFKQPVIILHVSFRTMSTCPVCLEQLHEEQAYSAVEQQSANAVVRTVAGWAPHLEFINFRRRLFLVFTFASVLRACCLKLNVRSSVTPR